MIIEGLDIATSCGVAQVEKPGRLSSARCLCLYAEGENSEEKAGELAWLLMQRYRDTTARPQFVAIEMPMRNVMTFHKEGADLAGQTQKDTINPNALQLSGLAGAAVAILNCYRIPWGLVASKTWRNAYFGKQFVPPKVVVKKRNRKTGKMEETLKDDWKQAAIDMALRERISLPSTKAEQRDAAEAIGIAWAWEACTFIPKRHQAAFMALRTGQARAA
jgi:hypothetical protein